MNKMVMSLPKLMRELPMAEGILKYQKGIHMEMKGSLSSFIQKKKNTMKSTKKKKVQGQGEEEEE